MTCPIDIARLVPADETLLWRVLCHAAHMHGSGRVEEARANPDLSRYVDGFGRAGDFGVKAEVRGELVGAAFCRIWTGPDRGYGFVDASTPELAIACLPGHEGRGIGTRLLGALLEVSDETHAAMSLSVRDTNPAVRLYERFGFAKVAGSEVRNRVGTMSYVMRRPRA